MTTTIDFGTIKQASEPTITFTWPLPSGHAPTNWTGAALTGTMLNRATGTVTAVTGALVVTTGAARVCSWAMSPEDTGTAGTYQVTLLADVAGKSIYTLYGSLLIEENPAVTAVAGPGLVGIVTTLATWLAALKTAVQGFTSGNLVSNDGDTLTDSGVAVATVSGHIASTSNPHSVTAVQVDALPIDAGIVAVASGRDLATTDNGKILECTGTFALNCPNGLDTGFQVALVNVGTGTITITAATTLQSKDSAVTIDTQYAVATLYHRGSNVWLLAGDIA